MGAGIHRWWRSPPVSLDEWLIAGEVMLHGIASVMATWPDDWEHVCHFRSQTIVPCTCGATNPDFEEMMDYFQRRLIVAMGIPKEYLFGFQHERTTGLVAPGSIAYSDGI